jgi:hypothetical protein
MLKCIRYVGSHRVFKSPSNNALAQSGWSGGIVLPETWRKTLSAQLENISWKQARSDVEPFLLSSDESSLLTKENLEKLLRG